MEQKIETFARTSHPQNFLVVDENGDELDLTGYTVKIYVHDIREETDGTNIVDGVEVTYDDREDGEVSYIFTAADLDVTATAAIEATWQLLLDNTGAGGDVKRFTLPEPFIIRRNRVLPAL